MEQTGKDKRIHSGGRAFSETACCLSWTDGGYTLPAEWHHQSMVQLTWPHEGTDWNYMLDEVYACFIAIAREVALRQKLLVVTPYPTRVKKQLEQAGVRLEHVFFFECQTNDTWARDHAFLSVVSGENVRLLDFGFNGWGLKFAANWDNQINRHLHRSGMLTGEYVDCLDFILEGGSVESDGCGTLLTTSPCLLAPNRNVRYADKALLEEKLCRLLGMRRVLWLDYGFLAGDDTDSHIDTLARLCPEDTIAYVQCTDRTDEHYCELLKMEEQLKGFRTLADRPYRLIPLPLPDAVYDEHGERLPATYANFLILNDVVLMPVYNQPQKDAEAKRQLEQVFPERKVLGIDCSALICQHGSLHCVTMQYPCNSFGL